MYFVLDVRASPLKKHVTCRYFVQGLDGGEREQIWKIVLDINLRFELPAFYKLTKATKDIFFSYNLVCEIYWDLQI